MNFFCNVYKYDTRICVELFASSEEQPFNIEIGVKFVITDAEFILVEIVKRPSNFILGQRIDGETFNTIFNNCLRFKEALNNLQVETPSVIYPNDCILTDNHLILVETLTKLSGASYLVAGKKISFLENSRVTQISYKKKTVTICGVVKKINPNDFHKLEKMFNLFKIYINTKFK